ncbi:MAG TPA: SHOCT domain-containing protein [Nitrososphaeraceae archaeon]|nr:SHOCT domain-containing protein [Nitrososphaeraceae archaeon]
MNVHLAINMKRFVSSPILGEMMILIIIIVAYAVTSSFFAPNIGAKAYAQVDNNSNDSNTLILEDMRAILRDQQRDIASIRNTSSAEAELLQNITTAQLEVLEDINITSTKLASQGAFSALSVFFLGIGLVIFGLRLTSRVAPRIGRSLNIMVWALTVPVIILIGLYQHGVITGAPLFTVTEEPYFLITFLLYIPISIVVFLLLEERGFVQDQAAHISRPIHEMERLAKLKERGEISEEEFQKLKTELLAKL